MLCLSPSRIQERLWKQAAAVRLCQEAACFDRSKLRRTQTKVLYIEDKVLGKVRPDGKPDFPGHVQQHPQQQQRGKAKKDKGAWRGHSIESLLRLFSP